MEFFKQANRITNKWTKTTAEAFGNTPAVRKGRAGEIFIMDVMQSWGWDVIDYEDNRKMQLKQIDIEFKDPRWANYYSASIKANMDDNGYIYVYDNWIHVTQSDRIFHCNPKTGWLCWYDTKLMQKYYRENFDQQLLNSSGDSYMKISPAECRDFIKRRKHGGRYGA